MQIDDNFQPMFSRPNNRLFQIRKLTLNIRLASGYVKRPVANRQTNMVEPKMGRVSNAKIPSKDHVPSRFDSCKVVLVYPGIPMFLEGS